MRIEGQDQGRYALLSCLFQCPTQHSLVTAMNAIEIADRNDATPQIFR